ncbi:MAG: ABC transporter substrate-binding protein [Clostridiales bacterium]|jgi:multiple sugar transport system substrate-binding protein|nr:ABC transporter substrate-binding protein [Clostridiales bacterium]
MKKLFTRKLVAVLITVVMFIGGTAACGSLAGGNLLNAAATTGTASDGGKTISIATLYNVIGQETLARQYMDAHPGTTITINSFMYDYDRYLTEVPTMLMSGTADDLMEGYINYKDSRVVAYLADFNALMDADPTFDREDYYANFFEALEYKGGLYAYPFDFVYDAFAINNKLVGAAREKVDSMNALSYFDMFELFDIAGGAFPYPDYANDPLDALLYTIDSFVDLENSACDFNNARFIELIKRSKELTEPDSRSHGSLSTVTPDDEKLFSEKYLLINTLPQTYQYLLPIKEETLFSGHKPLISEQGKLLTMAPAKFCLSKQSENKDLAWDFIRFIQDPQTYADEDGNITGSFRTPSINKELFRIGLEYALLKPGTEINAAGNLVETESFFDWIAADYGWHVPGDRRERFDEVLARYDEILSMPVQDRTLVLFPQNVQDVFYATMDSYLQGLITAEQTAEELQNKISIALRE